MLVFTNPVSPDDDAGSNEWYNSIHLPQVVERVEGIAGARRYELDDDTTGRKHLALYELDLDSATVRTNEAMSSGRLDSSDLLQRDPHPSSCTPTEVERDDGRGWRLRDRRAARSVLPCHRFGRLRGVGRSVHTRWVLRDDGTGAHGT
ncbi:MAG: hypothetical protein ACR2MB_16615 [Acidimicrobiales bacterium]